LYEEAVNPESAKDFVRYPATRANPPCAAPVAPARYNDVDHLFGRWEASGCGLTTGSRCRISA
jgi:hypothetical protein